MQIKKRSNKMTKQINKQDMEKWLDNFSDAVDILMDIYNGGYSVEAFRMDIDESFQGE